VLDLLARLIDSAKPEEEQRAWETFQRCAEESGVHGVATHQQRAGDVEQRTDKRPTREGLKGSKGVLEVADTLIGVYRPALVQSVDDKVLEAIVLKQRRGRWPFAVRFDFDPKRWSIAKGREVAYLRPGEDGLDDVVDRQRAGGRSRS
jgi:replicative DNA helicase